MEIDFDKMDGLVPAIVQDDFTRKVLMLGFMNKEAFDLTVSTGKVTFYSRTRKCLWTKGETSGNFLNVVSIKNDCDNDTLLIQVHPTGPVCHKGTDTCWGEKNERESLLFLTELQNFIEQRHREMPTGSYTTSLFNDGLNRMAQKVGEEALELVIEACNGTNDRLIYEGSDMLYHLIVLLTSKGLRIEQMAEELKKRHQPGWKKN
jgi:phosphoribosyl-ATP pyrophosphohydrolase/phosphoribosyl-AMP cyclohydrolase